MQGCTAKIIVRGLRFHRLTIKGTFKLKFVILIGTTCRRSIVLQPFDDRGTVLVLVVAVS